MAPDELDEKIKTETDKEYAFEFAPGRRVVVYMEDGELHFFASGLGDGQLLISPRSGNHCVVTLGEDP